MQKHKKKRYVWVDKLWKERKLQGHHSNLIKEMRLKDHTMLFNYFRMLPSIFDELLSLVGPSIVRKGSIFREPLSTSLKLVVTLRILQRENHKHHFRSTFELAGHQFARC